MTTPNPLDRSQHRPAARPAAPAEDVQDDAVIGRAFRASVAVIAGVAILVLSYQLFKGFLSAPETVEATDVLIAKPRELPERTPPAVPLVDITAASGLDFVHENGAAGEKLLPETMGGGGGFFDYDSDGDPDLLLVNSRRWPWDGPGDEPAAVTRLYENDGTGHFTDVTADSGPRVSLYGMGCAFGDYDGDGGTRTCTSPRWARISCSATTAAAGSRT